MTLHDTILADGLSVFCNADDFAESVIYYNRTGDARCIDAVVIREALAILPEDGDAVTPIFEIHVHNDDTTGISSLELNLGGDSIAFAVREGQERSRRTIVRLLGHDEGMLMLECR
jgi:hypothetical protein